MSSLRLMPWQGLRAHLSPDGSGLKIRYLQEDSSLDKESSHRERFQHPDFHRCGAWPRERIHSRQSAWFPPVFQFICPIGHFIAKVYHSQCKKRTIGYFNV